MLGWQNVDVQNTLHGGSCLGVGKRFWRSLVEYEESLFGGSWFGRWRVFCELMTAKRLFEAFPSGNAESWKDGVELWGSM